MDERADEQKRDDRGEGDRGRAQEMPPPRLDEEERYRHEEERRLAVQRAEERQQAERADLSFCEREERGDEHGEIEKVDRLDDRRPLHGTEAEAERDRLHH